MNKRQSTRIKRGRLTQWKRLDKIEREKKRQARKLEALERKKKRHARMLEELRIRYKNRPPALISVTRDRNIRFKNGPQGKRLWQLLRRGNFVEYWTNIDVPECKENEKMSLSFYSDWGEKSISFPANCNDPSLNIVHKIVNILTKMPDVSRCPRPHAKSMYELSCSQRLQEQAKYISLTSSDKEREEIRFINKPLVKVLCTLFREGLENAEVN